MSKVRLYGDTSGFVDLKAPDVAGDVTITLPNTSGPFATETYVDAAVAAIPEIAGIGTNVVQGVVTGTWSTTSGTFQPITGLAAAITPTSSLSKILVLVHINATANTGDYGAFFQLQRNGTDIAKSTTTASSLHTLGSTQFLGFGVPSVSVAFLDSPATTSLVTYQMLARVHTGSFSGSVLLNRSQNNQSGTISTITAIEVAA